jgi:hypothetical protein
MIVNLKRKAGMMTGTQTPTLQNHLLSTDLGGVPTSSGLLNGYHQSQNGGAQSGSTSAPPDHHHQHQVVAAPLPPIRLEDLDFSWPPDMMFSPATIPAWLQEAVRSWSSRGYGRVGL